MNPHPDQLDYHETYQTNKYQSQLIQKVDFDELSEDHGFTTLHKIVCGIDLRDLDLEVQRNPHNVDKLDRDGRNPLWYAVAHGNTQFVRRLLQRGADPNLGGSAIIVEAIKWAQLETVELLMTFGFNFTDLRLDTLLEAWKECDHWYPDDLLQDCWVIESLVIRHWVDVNRQTTCGMTLLMFLCSHTNSGPDGIAQLIRRGAKLELRNISGETAILLCIDRPWEPKTDAFLKLVHAGARLDVQDYAGTTVLHRVVHRVSYGTTGLMHLLKAMQDVDVSQFDLDARDEDGYTAFDLLKKRNGITWESYYVAKRGKRWEAYDEYETPTIRGLESLFHRIQDSQGIPVEQQYPPLADHLCEQTDDNTIPGAWPL
ncbi:MAG: hypothetical protein Q9161_005946 [Pseudevernia consocians]